MASVNDNDETEATGHETDDPATTRQTRVNGTRPRSHHATKSGVGSASELAKPPNAEEAPWSDRDAGMILCEMLGGEHPRSLKAHGKTAWDIVAEIRRTDGSGGQSAVLATIAGQDLQGDDKVTPQDAIRNAVTERVHLVSARSPVDYDIWFMWRSPPRLYGKGKLHLPSPDEIIALRGANRQQPQSYQQPSPPPPQQPPIGYGAPVYPPQQPPPPPYGEPQGSPWGRRQDPPSSSHDPEVSNLRSEVAGLSGAVRELMEIVRGDRQRPLPQAPPPAPPHGFAGSPPQPPSPGWPRRARPGPDDEVLEELEDVRDENQVLREEIHRLRRGVGAAPPVQRAYAPPAPSPQVHVQPQPPRVPDGPSGEVWVEGVGWCVPQSRIKSGIGGAPPTAAAPVPVAAVPATSAPTPPSPAPQAVGVGASTGALELIMQRVQTRVMQKVAREVETMVEGAFSGAAGLGADPGEPEAPPEPDKPEDILPFVTAKVEGATLFGQPVHYAADKETGDVSLLGLGFANPVLAEKAMEVLQIGADALQKFVGRSAVTTGAAQISAGVGTAPAPAQAQVVDTIPADAQHAGGPGSFPRV
jgi:hypothetical protein